ncbi:DUF167 domain-containing protein [Verrucomicrobiota bacterium]
MDFLEEKANSVILRVRVVPRASRTEVQGVYGDELKIRLNAPPVDGKANASLVKFLSKKLNVSKGSIKLQSGEASRSKRLVVSELSSREIIARLGCESG